MKRPWHLVLIYLLSDALSATHAQEASVNYSACLKSSQTVAFNERPEQQLSFDYLDCSDNDLHLPRLRFEAGNILRTVTSAGEDAVGPTAQFFSLAGKTPETRMVEIAEAAVAPEEKGRCRLTYVAVEGAWHYTATDDYFEEIAANGLWSACGPFGESSETVQYWMLVPGGLIAYVSLLQDRPLFDPDSFKYANTYAPGVAE